MAARGQAVFLEGSLFRHVAVMSLTASIGLMGMFMVDFVDLIFISWLGRPELTAAIGYAGIVLFFTTSVSIGSGIAAGALVARALGGGETARARTDATHALTFGVCVCVLISQCVWFNLPALMALVGASETTAPHAVAYLSIVVPSLPILLVGMAGGFVLRAHGDARRSMLTTLYGGLANLVLDPIFIFGFGWGLEGAAVASVGSRFFVVFVALWPLIRVHDALARPNLVSFLGRAPAIAAIALPAVLTNVATPVGNAIVMRFVAEYGEAAVAGIAIVSRLQPLAFAVVFAMSGAVGPIIGQNFGARQHERVRGAFIEGLRFAAGYVLVASLVLFLLREPLALVFRAEALTRDLLFLFCGPLALMFFFNVVLFVSNAACNNLDRASFSTLLNWGRNTIGTLPFVWLGAHWWGAAGVLIGQAAGGVLFALIGVVVAFKVMRHQATRWPPFDEPGPTASPPASSA